MSAVAAIILAAGLGKRFGGSSKPLASLGGRPMIRYVCDAALASTARPVLVVVGHRGEEVGRALEGLDLVLVDSPAYAEGLSRSLQAGLAALPGDASAAVILLADMPLVAPETVDALIEGWRAAPDAPAVIPVHEGRRGNPVLLSRRIFPAIAALAGDQGAGPLLKRLPGVVEIQVDDPAILRDIDTPEALAALGSERDG